MDEGPAASEAVQGGLDAGAEPVASIVVVAPVGRREEVVVRMEWAWVSGVVCCCWGSISAVWVAA